MEERTRSFKYDVQTVGASHYKLFTPDQINWDKL